MAITKEETEKLQQAKQAFNVHTLTRQQVEIILRRKLNDKVWHDYETSEGRKLKKTNTEVYSVKHLFKQLKKKPKKPDFSYSDIAKHAAKKAQRSRTKQLQQDTDEIYRVARLFKSKQNKIYRIEKIREYKFDTFNSTRSHWKIHGDVNIFQINTVIEELIRKMTEGLSDNVKLQIILENDKNDQVNQTGLLNKADMIAKLVDWVILFIDYHDMDIEDITIKLLKIKIPQGAGRVNRIITVGSKRSIIQIKNKDTICLARAIVVGLAVNHKEKLQTTFKNNLTEDEMKEINKSRKDSSLINEGIVSENEKSYLIDGRKIQKVLAHALHRICSIPIKQTGNDFQDVKLFEEKLDIEIQIYNLESRQIYKGCENQIKVYILMSDSHYDVISNITGFTCLNLSENKSRDRKCKACKSENKCNTEEPQMSCIKCCKYFYEKSCFNNHVENKKCIAHSYMCKKCHRFYKTADVVKLKCGNCKEYVNEGHQCYILKKDIKPHSEKYWFFDFEAKLDMRCK